MTSQASTARTVTVSTKFGSKSVQTALDVKQAIQVLSVQQNPSNFAADLIRSYGKYGLSVNQANWAIYLAQESIDKQAKPQTPAPVLANARNLFLLFGTAHLNLKYPRLRVQTADGRLVVIKLSGSGSKHCGSLNLTNGVKYGDPGAVFYGFVHQDGTTTIRDQGVLELIQALAHDPAGVTAQQGLASGECCFCGRCLSDSEAGSSEIGYGPICAQHWSLPWTRNGQAEPVAVTQAASKPKRTRKTKTTLAKEALKAVYESMDREISQAD